MIISGLKITVLGVGIVFIFLLLIVLSINILYKLLKDKTDQEYKDLLAARDLKNKKKLAPVTEDNVLIAVISAAVSAHRSGAF
ncbi:MAG: OadG family protein [Deltaproteobacteria bacterium]|nr:OadG family protein [Deltaproteobacteria bacterium]